MAYDQPDHHQGMPRRRGRSVRRRSSMGTSVLIGLSAVVVAAIVAVIGVVMLQSPSKLIEQQLQAQVRSATGRELTVAGGSSITFWPSIGVAFDDIRLSAPPEMNAPDTIRAARLGTNIALWPLLTGRAVVESITLDQPVINLRIDEQGRASWRFGALSPSAQPVRYAQSGTTLNDAGIRVTRPFATALPELVASLERLKLNGLQIVDGVVEYSDARSGAAERVDDIDLTLDRFDVNAPSELSGSLVARGSRVELSGRVGALRQLADDQRIDLALRLATDESEASLNGTVDFAEAGTFFGPLEASAENLGALARRLGIVMPDANGLGAASISGNVRLTTERLQLDQASITVGGVQAQGSLTIDVGSERPVVLANLRTTGTIDIDRMSDLYGSAQPASGDADARGAVAPSAYDPRANAQQQDGSRSGSGNPADRDGWSTVPIDTAPLTALDIDAILDLEAMKVRGLQIGRTSARVRQTDGVFRTDIGRMDLYEGTGSGAVSAAADPDGVAIGIYIKLASVSVRPLLQDYADFDGLAGRGDIDLRLNTRGPHEAALVQGASGSLSVQFRDGAVVGWNIAKLLRGLSQGQISDLDRIATEETDFSELDATFDVRSGIAGTNDLRLVSPLIRMSGEGRIMAPDRELDLMLRPRLVASLQGQGAATTGSDQGGLEVPVRVSGPWADPTVEAQLGELFSDPDKIGRAVDNIKRQFEGKSVGEVIDELTGKDGGGGAKKLLEGLFGR